MHVSLLVIKLMTWFWQSNLVVLWKVQHLCALCSLQLCCKYWVGLFSFAFLILWCQTWCWKTLLNCKYVLASFWHFCGTDILFSYVRVKQLWCVSAWHCYLACADLQPVCFLPSPKFCKNCIMRLNSCQNASDQLASELKILQTCTWSEQHPQLYWVAKNPLCWL